MIKEKDITSLTPPKKKSVDPKCLDKTPPHSWTHEQGEFLEQITRCISRGLAPDNGNLNKKGWTHVMNYLNELFDLTLTCDQIKNAKNQPRDLYVDTKFFREQSGFGWDLENETVTWADSKTWDELIKAHPHHKLGKLMGNLFPFYDLAHQVFSGTLATGKIAAEEMTNLTIPTAANDTPQVQPIIKPKKKEKKEKVRWLLSQVMKRRKEPLFPNNAGSRRTRYPYSWWPHNSPQKGDGPQVTTAEPYWHPLRNSDWEVYRHVFNQGIRWYLDWICNFPWTRCEGKDIPLFVLNFDSNNLWEMAWPRSSPVSGHLTCIHVVHFFSFQLLVLCDSFFTLFLQIFAQALVQQSTRCLLVSCFFKCLTRPACSTFNLFFALACSFFSYHILKER